MSLITRARVAGGGFRFLRLWCIFPLMPRGKSGKFGSPFTKGNANAMRRRGLDIRRHNSAERLACKLRRGEEIERARQARLDGPGPSQPNRPPSPAAAELRPAIEARAARTDTAPVLTLQPEEQICYGYELAPGVWVEARVTAPQPNGLIAAAEAAARARQRVRRWNGKRRYDGPR